MGRPNDPYRIQRSVLVEDVICDRCNFVIGAVKFGSNKSDSIGELMETESVGYGIFTAFNSYIEHFDYEFCHNCSLEFKIVEFIEDFIKEKKHAERNESRTS